LAAAASKVPMKSIVLAVLLAAVAGISLLAVAQRGNTAEPQGNLRADVNLVSVYFTVRDKKERLVTDLEKSAFKVLEDGRQQDITFFSHHSDVPMNVGVLLDTSTSLSRTLGLEADAASHFFSTVMRPNDQGFLVSYASRIEVLQYPTDETQSLRDKAQVIRRNARADAIGLGPQRQAASRFPIPSTIPDPASLRVARLYDAVEFSVDRFLTMEVGRKAIVIAALADDARSESTLREALRTLKENDVIAYVLEVQHAPRANSHDDCDILHIFRNEPENRIARLALETGGRVIKVEGFEKMQAAFEQIAEELHHQYSLGYRPLNQKWDGAFRRVTIDAGRDYKVSARDGYYARPRN
jgi:VWFA-related protein